MDFKNIDWSQYQAWQPVQTPTGGVQYLVPNTDWVYDPFVSAQTGKVQLFRNPKPAMDAQAAQEQAYKEANSPSKQIMGTALPLAAALGGKYLYDNYLATGSATAEGTGLGSALSGIGSSISNGISNLFGGGAAAAAPTAAAPTAAGFLSGATGAKGAVEPFMAYSNLAGDAGDLAAANAASSSAPGMLESAGSFMNAPSSTLGGYTPMQGLAALGALKGGYDAISGFEHGGKGMRTGTTELGAGIGTMLLPGIGTAIGAIGGNVLGYGMKRLGLFHKTTKQREEERWGKLADKGITGAQEAFLAAHSPNDDGIWKDGPTAGKKWNWEDAVMRAKANPAEFRGVYGNFDTFGNDWATYAPQQQDEIVKRLINANLYDPEKGDITIKDKEAARRIKDQVLSGDPETSALQKNIIPGQQLQSDAQKNTTISPPGAPAPAVPAPAPAVPAPTPQPAITPGPQSQPVPGVTFKTVNVAPPPPPPMADLGKQLANRMNKFNAGS